MRRDTRYTRNAPNDAPSYCSRLFSPPLCFATAAPRRFACMETRFARSNRFAVYGRARLPRPRLRLLAQARGGAWVARTAPLCPRRRAPRVLAWRRFSASCRFFAFFALAARAGRPNGRFYSLALVASRSPPEPPHAVKQNWNFV